MRCCTPHPGANFGTPHFLNADRRPQSDRLRGDTVLAHDSADVQTPDYQEKTRSTGGEPVSSTPEEFAALTHADSRMTAEMVKAIGLKPE